MNAMIPKSCDLVLILSLIRQESGFNPLAQSKAGAKGLMQIMPATWNEWAGVTKLKKANPFNPLHNIIVGCLELNRQIDNFGKLDLALTAYNWGSGNLKRLMTAAKTDDLEMLKRFTREGESIKPMPKEAQEYAMRIFKHYNDPSTLEYANDFVEILR